MNKPSCFTQQQYKLWLDTPGAKRLESPCEDCQSTWQSEMIQQRKCDNPGYICDDVFKAARISRSELARKSRSDYERKPRKKKKIKLSGETKTCKRCQHEKPIEDFSRFKKSGKFYYMGTCKECIAERERIRYREQRRMAMS